MVANGRLNEIADRVRQGRPSRGGPAMRVMDVVNEAKGAMRASEVFGTPYEKNGITIIPAAKIAGGAGGGGDQQNPQVGGVGFGVSPRPVRGFLIKVVVGRWPPGLDLT